MPELHSLNEMNENDNGFHTEWAIPKWIWNRKIHIKTPDSYSMIWGGLAEQLDFLHQQLQSWYSKSNCHHWPVKIFHPIHIYLLFLWQENRVRWSWSRVVWVWKKKWPQIYQAVEHFVYFCLLKAWALDKCDVNEMII